MSIIQQHTAASLSDAWRTINIDALEEDSPLNFDTSTLRPPQPEISEAEVRGLAGQVRQLLRGGDTEGALRGCLEFPVYNGVDAAKDAHLQTITEVLHSIKASDMTPLLQNIYGSAGGSELLDVLMKYIYKGMGAAGPASVGAAMSVLLSWHEKVVDVAGLGCIGRVMTDWRRV
ncbi:hypothetical protein ACRALDRAFT_2094505 [Sodiomyces alcalophilus JCM 7366]|uniref:uncharacterized protein n=1 Tax=Sodiomyces alcalophilus JCM 7366 TaxID=591952 RepID=UPI0039B5F34B